MAALSRLLTAALGGLSLLSPALAYPKQIDTIRRLLRRDTFEWTALGDSYSSGVGADAYFDGSYRCLRYDHAYPVLLNDDQRLHEGEHTFNNVVCSGSNTADVEAYQFYDEPTRNEPSWQFGVRPAFGKPTMATLSVGGNDIDFPGIIFNCILEWHIYGGPPKRTCPEQKELTWSKLIDPGLAEKISATIKKVVTKGREGPIGQDFKLYVTGFPQFFSIETKDCDDVTFARSANPNDDGKEHVKLTQENRKEYNDMSVQLNKAIESAVQMNEDNSVYWVPIDPSMDGHRYCERGIKEPNQQNENLWLYHYPYNEPEPPEMVEPLKKAAAKVTLEEGETYADYESRVYEELEGDPNQQDWEDWMFKKIGDRVKVFHPQVALHEKIRDLVLGQYINDLEDNEGEEEEEDEDREYPCVPDARPAYTSAVCQCSTTVDGEVQALTTDMIDNACDAYTTYPAEPTTAEVITEGPVQEPFTTTIDGTVLAYDAYTVMYGGIGVPGVTVTNTVGVGDPKTLSVPTPTQIAVDNDGNGQCGTSDGLSKEGLGEACDRAIGRFEDNVTYTEFTSRYSRSKKGILIAASFGQAACYVDFECEDFGGGMTGKQIKEARENAKSNDDIWICGHIKLSNTCTIKLGYCTDCNEKN